MGHYFPINLDAAKKANVATRLAPHEYHVVKITQAYWGQAVNGSQYLALSFVNARQEKASELYVYFANEKGEQLPGYNMINALMAVNQIQGLSYTEGIYQTYDFESRDIVDKKGYIAPELVGCFAGVVLSERYYVNKEADDIRYALDLSAVYAWRTKQNAKQYLESIEKGGQIDTTIDYEKQVNMSIAYAIKSSERSEAQAKLKLAAIKEGVGHPQDAYNQSESQPAGFQQAPTAQTQPQRQQAPTASAPPTPQQGVATQRTVAPSPVDDDMPF